MEGASDDKIVERKPRQAEETDGTEHRDHHPSKRDSRNRRSKGLSRSPNERGSSSRRLSRNRDSKGLSRSPNHEKGRSSSSRRLSTSRKQSEKPERRSSSRKRRNSNENHHRHRRMSSAERTSLRSSDRTRSSRHKYSNTRPSRSKSFDDSWDDSHHDINTVERQSLEAADDSHNGERRISKEKSQRRRRRSRDGDSDHDPTQSTDVRNALYGNDKDAKTKSSKVTSERAIVPGVEYVGSKSSRTTATLYGHDDSNAKAKAIDMGASSHRGTIPGVEQIDSSTNRSAHALYEIKESNTKVKAKEPAKTPGVHQVNAHIPSTTMHSAGTSTLSDPDAEGTTENILYGKDRDAKAKAKASNIRIEPATSPGVDRVFSRSSSSVWSNAKKSRRSFEKQSSSSNHTNANTTLYGDNGVDAKAKAKASRGSSSNPGVETIVANNSMHTATSTLYGSEAASKAKYKASGGSSTFASNPDAKSVASAGSTVDTLYGNDARAKARARVSLGGAAVPGVENLANHTMDDYNGQHATIAEEPVARIVSVDMGYTGTDSESDSVSDREPERNMDATGGNKLSSEAKENLQLPNDPEAPSRRHGKSAKNGVEDEADKKSRKKRCILWLLFFSLLLLIGTGVAVWYFLLRNDGTANEDTQNAKSSSVQDPTQSPASPTRTSFMPTVLIGVGNPVEFPSSAPSMRFIYEPPSESDCQDIAANQTIAGREEKENANFELGVEVVPAANTTLTEPLLEALLDAIQQKILPSLAGCSVIIDELVEAWRFVIFDAFVTGSVPTDETCSDEDLMQLNCHRVSVKLDLFLKGSVRFLDIIALISDQGDNISNHLGLKELFSYIKLTGAQSLIATDAPTRMPSATPSFNPTDLPTATASFNPTGTPSMWPTRAPTGEPSISPTMIPSDAPSMSPTTTPPTGFPSEQPSLVPSDDPSVRPTTMFSGTPTERPTVPPSARPTAAPTKYPTVMPSHLPSSSPTDRPSLSPSNSPTKFPTFAPSLEPSTFPSTLPTPRPSFFPTPIPTYATQIITQAYGPYTNYPVSQSSIGYGGDPIRAIDGNNSGNWRDRSVTHTNNNLLDQWWQVDLATGAGRPVVVKYITVWNRTDCCTNRLIGAVVQLLDAGQNDITPAGVDNVLTDVRETTIDFGLVPNVSFVKIGKDYTVSLAEVEIYGYVPL